MVVRVGRNSDDRNNCIVLIVMIVPGEYTSAPCSKELLDSSISERAPFCLTVIRTGNP